MRGSAWGRMVEEFRHWLRPDWSFADVADHWDSTKDYDEQNSRTVSYFRRFVDGLRLSNIPDGARILDICARTGNGTLYFAQHGKVGSAVCAEVSENLASIGKSRLDEAGVKNVSWLHLTEYTLPFDDEEFDAVLCFETTEHFSAPRTPSGGVRPCYEAKWYPDSYHPKPVVGAHPRTGSDHQAASLGGSSSLYTLRPAGKDGHRRRL